MDAAQPMAIDAEATVIIKETRALKFPGYLALFNHISKKAFRMRLDRPMKLSAMKLIPTTSQHADHVLDRPIVILQHRIESNFYDAIYLKAFQVRLGDGIPETFAKRLCEARFSLSIDGESIISEESLRGLLGREEILLPVKERTLLFHAYEFKDGAVDMDHVDMDHWVGYMLPNGTQILAELEQVPGGGGLIRLEIDWHYGIYTTIQK